MIVLALNSGSSSLKLSAFEARDGELEELARGEVEDVGGEHGRAWMEHRGERRVREARAADAREALSLALSLFTELEVPAPAAIGHRVVHGGPTHLGPAKVDEALLCELRSLIELAPIHMPPALETIDAVMKRYPETPQVACFDTAFHAALPEHVKRLPLPNRFAGVRRYGFHGLSFEYVMSALGPSAPARIVIAHLGNGSSLAAVRDGRPIDTTMSFTPAGGVMMGTRTGDIDPGVLFYLARAHGLSLDELEHVALHESGLRGVGGTSDMRELLRRAPADPDAALAVTMFSYGVRKAVGGFIAALGGLDLLVFTGGIGENVPRVRSGACEGLLEVTLDPERNERGAEIISAASSRALVRVVATDEARQVAQQTLTVMRGERP